MKKIFIAVLLFSMIPWTLLHSQEKAASWERLSGKWIFENSKVTETQGTSLTWKYYELLEYNSILSVKSFKDYSSIDINAEIKDRIETPAEFMYSFAVTSESKSWFYHLYAFKLSGGYWGINKVSLIYADRLDKTKQMNAKNNTFIKELASADCKVKYNKTYNYRISFEGTDVVLYINGEKVLSAPFPEKTHDGRIAVSARNVKIALDKVAVKQNDQFLFEDDFNIDSIYVRVLKAERIPSTNGDKDTVKKP